MENTFLSYDYAALAMLLLPLAARVLQSHRACINFTQITQQWMMVNLALMIINEVVIAKSLIIHIIFRLIFFSLAL